MKKKILAIAISTILIASVALCIFAFNYGDTQNNIYVIHKSSAEDLQYYPKDDEFITDFNIKYNISDEGEIEVYGDIEGTEFSVKGSFTTISKHGENETSCIALCFEGEDSYESYDVLSMVIFQKDTIADISFISAYYLFGGYEAPEYTDCLTVHLKLPDKDEFILIEILLDNNFVENYSARKDLVYDSHKAYNTVLWALRYVPGRSD